MFNNIIESRYFIFIVSISNLLLLAVYIMSLIKLKKTQKNYRMLMQKLGKGHDMEEMISRYIEKVELIEEKNKELNYFCHRLNEDLTLCIRKVGLVRYSAFKDAGKDLSFALALLNDNNDGIVLNGIYSREMSNIYAKHVKGGKTENNLSEEEAKAIQKACDIEK